MAGAPTNEAAVAITRRATILVRPVFAPVAAAGAARQPPTADAFVSFIYIQFCPLGLEILRILVVVAVVNPSSCSCLVLQHLFIF